MFLFLCFRDRSPLYHKGRKEGKGGGSKNLYFFSPPSVLKKIHIARCEHDVRDKIL